MNVTTALKTTAASMAALAIFGCSKEPKRVEQTTNKDIQFEVLFTRHGCEVGRFYDAGHSVYSVICPDGPSRVEYYVPNGRSVTKYETLTSGPSHQFTPD